MTKRILIVEDEPALRFALQDYLDHAGYTVDAAARLADANTLLAGAAYDVVITDLLLSGTCKPEGLEVIARVHELDSTVPVVVLTGCDVPSVEESARRLGIDRFLRKPVPLSLVAGTVSALVAR